jgi:hypothetical protein
MPKSRTDDLVQLVRSLTKSEKRHFRLFVQRNQLSDNLLFLQLFDYLDKYGEYDEGAILKKLPEVKKSQLPNLKAHLTKQLLTSLRLLNKNQSADIQIREQIDYARVLYNKGLYRQSLDWLARTKDDALKGNFSTQALEIIEFEKLIESQYITHSLEGRAEELTAQSLRLTHLVAHSNEYSSLSLQMYGLYLKTGFARNRKDYFFVREFFKSRLPATPFERLDFWGKVYYCQAHVWMYHICQEFAPCYRYAQTWVDMFNSQPAMIELHPPLYLKGLHNLLNALFNSLHYDRFLEALAKLEQFPQLPGIVFDKNIESLFELYRFIHRINRHYLEGSFGEGLLLVPGLIGCLEKEQYNWDSHRVMVFYYRIASLYFANRMYNESIEYLNKIINQKNPDYREDIQCFARILCLIAHFELGNDQLVEYQIKSVYRFLLQVEDLHEVQKEIFRFLRRTPGMRRTALLDEFRRLHEKLIKLQEDAFERRPFMYLDIISWLETKLENRTIEAIVQDKFRRRQEKGR